MTLALFVFTVVVGAAIVYGYARLHTRLLRRMRLNAGDAFSTARAYVSWVAFALLIVPLGVFMPLLANGRIGAFEPSEFTVAALIVAGAVIAAIATALAFRRTAQQ